jgi:ABC-type multidrug transport system permease subunit
MAFSWIIALLGNVVWDPESAGIGGLLAVIPLIFVSSTFVPLATVPGWLQAFAKLNPITITADARLPTPRRSLPAAWKPGSRPLPTT